jgi:hypothetical protein
MIVAGFGSSTSACGDAGASTQAVSLDRDGSGGQGDPGAEAGAPVDAAADETRTEAGAGGSRPDGAGGTGPGGSGGSGDSGGGGPAGWSGSGDCMGPHCENGKIIGPEGYGPPCNTVVEDCEHGCTELWGNGKPVCIIDTHPCPGLFGLDPWANQPYRLDCNGNAADGNETDVRTDPWNCGACGHSCRGGDCKAGLCTPTVLAPQHDKLLGVAVDQVHACAMDFSHGGILQVRKDGTGGPVAFADDKDLWWCHPSVEVTADSVFWPNSLFQVRRAAKAGGVSQLACTAGNEVQAFTVRGDQLLFVTQFGLYKAAIGGGAPVKLGDADTSSWAVAFDNAFAYWATAFAVKRVSLEGGAEQVVAASAAKDGVAGIAVDDSNVYWTNLAEGKVLRAPKGGGAPEMLASGQQSPAGLRIDATSVYWSNLGTEKLGWMSGAVMKVAKAGGAARPLACYVGPDVVAIDDEAVYFGGEKSGVVRVPK